MRIGEFAGASGTTTKTLRFYEDQGLLPAAGRTPSGYRDYSPDMLGRLDFIHRAEAAGLTLAQIRQILDIRDLGTPPCRRVSDLLAERRGDLDAQIAQLVDFRRVIAELHDSASVAEPDTWPADQVCRSL